MNMRPIYKQILRFFLAVVMLLVAAAGLLPQSVSAQDSTPSQGLTISPFLLERQMDKGQSTEELIEITNTSDQGLPVNISIQDFTPGDNGQQVFLDPGKGDPRFSLSNWITIHSNAKPYLEPHERTSLSFSITAPHNATDGGHYGAIMFTFQPTQASGSAVVVSQKIGAIILVKLGKANEAGQITSFKAQKSFSEYPPVSFTTRFSNSGNVHVKPRGSISISNMFGRKVANVLVNENAFNVLPGTEREFSSVWKDSFAFGPYTAEVKLVYGDSGQVETAKLTFWVIPWKVTLVIAFILFIVLVILVGGIRRYNRWLLSKALQQRRPRG